MKCANLEIISELWLEAKVTDEGPGMGDAGYWLRSQPGGAERGGGAGMGQLVQEPCAAARVRVHLPSAA